MNVVTGLGGTAALSLPMFTVSGRSIKKSGRTRARRLAARASSRDLIDAPPPPPLSRPPASPPTDRASAVFNLRPPFLVRHDRVVPPSRAAPRAPHMTDCASMGLVGAAASVRLLPRASREPTLSSAVFRRHTHASRGRRAGRTERAGAVPRLPRLPWLPWSQSLCGAAPPPRGCCGRCGPVAPWFPWSQSLCGAVASLVLAGVEALLDPDDDGGRARANGHARAGARARRGRRRDGYRRRGPHTTVTPQSASTQPSLVVFGALVHAAVGERVVRDVRERPPAHRSRGVVVLKSRPPLSPCAWHCMSGSARRAPLPPSLLTRCHTRVVAGRRDGRRRRDRRGRRPRVRRARVRARSSARCFYRLSIGNTASPSGRPV